MPLGGRMDGELTIGKGDLMSAVLLELDESGIISSILGAWAGVNGSDLKSVIIGG